MAKTVVLIGRPGAGKTLLRRTLHQMGMTEIIPFTPNKLHSNDINSGRFEYLYKDKFEDLARCGHFLEENANGLRYGTLRRSLKSPFKFRRHVMILDPKTASQLSKDDVVVVDLVVSVEDSRDKMISDGLPDTMINEVLERFENYGEVYQDTIDLFVMDVDTYNSYTFARDLINKIEELDPLHQHK